MHCDRCLKAAALEQLEPVGPFGEKMCGDCREVFAAAAAAVKRCGRDYGDGPCTLGAGHEGGCMGPCVANGRPLELERAPAPVIDGAHAFGNHMVEWRN